MKRRKKKSTLKKVLRYTGLLILVLLLWFYREVSYGISQAYGQLKIIYKSQPIEKVLKDPEFPDSLKSKLLLVQEIKRFAFDSIGLNKSDNYTTVYNQKGKPVLWVLTAAERYELKNKEWDFPLLGSVGYKGFFDHKRGIKERIKLQAQGYDTDLDVVSGWSTLGWFKDPILSNMLFKKEGNLANLIIHELTHTTLYIPGNVDFNENLASFVGDIGAEMFLKQKYGTGSQQYETYEKGKKDYELYITTMLKGKDRLDSLYKTFNELMPETIKDSLKFLTIARIVEKAKRLPYLSTNFAKKMFPQGFFPNNTYFMELKRYHAEQNNFEIEFKTRFQSDFKKYFAYLKKKYPKNSSK